jgi:predicted nuclease of restriction endonuclease-like RecB superfamily
MRLALADVKKRVVRREGEPYLVPHLLRHGELESELGALIGLHEEWVGREHGTFPEDRPAELIGDYRLARCLVTALGESYAWSAPTWPGPANAMEAEALAASGIVSAAQLRLALYDAVNAAGGGYLAEDERELFLDDFAARLGLPRRTLDALLVLDAEGRTRLTRVAERAPTPAEVAALYNRRAVEALLASASSVEWLLTPEFAARCGLSLGTMLKRICFLARRTGVYYDVAFAQPEQPAERELPRIAEQSGPDYLRHAPETALDAAPAPLSVTLYGPQEAFGAPNQYGDRLARLCRVILGLNRTATFVGRAHPQREGGYLRGEAQVYLYGRAFHFVLDERLLALLEPAHATPSIEAAEAAAAPAYDSGLERQLHEEFAALERAGGAHGWRIEREPEPILCDDTILIPDFALTRGDRRVYLEVAGFWSPAYRERKRRKLAALAGRTQLIVAAPEDARRELSELEGRFPWLWFRGHVSAQSLVNLLLARFDDFPARRAALRAEDVLNEVDRRGWVPWGELSALLHAYGRSELAVLVEDLARAASDGGRDAPALVDGAGLVSPAWLSEIGGVLAGWVEAAGESGLALDDAAARLRARAPALALAGDGTALEALARATGHVVVRSSLFEPRIMAMNGEVHLPTRMDPEPEQTAGGQRRVQPRKPARRKEHREAETPQMLWNPPADC